MKNATDKNGLLYHKYSFRIKQNLKVWFCRMFGHELNKNVEDKWCNRCGLFYGEIYHNNKDWAEKI